MISRRSVISPYGAKNFRTHRGPYWAVPRVGRQECAETTYIYPMFHVDRSAMVPLGIDFSMQYSLPRVNPPSLNPGFVAPFFGFLKEGSSESDAAVLGNGKAVLYVIISRVDRDPLRDDILRK